MLHWLLRHLCQLQRQPTNPEDEVVLESTAHPTAATPTAALLAKGHSACQLIERPNPAVGYLRPAPRHSEHQCLLLKHPNPAAGYLRPALRHSDQWLLPACPSPAANC